MAEEDKALKKLRLGHALEGTQDFKQNGPAKLSLPLPVFIPLEAASKQVRATAFVVSELLDAKKKGGVATERKQKVVHDKIGNVGDEKETLL